MSLELFCQNPNGENFRALEPYMQSLCYSTAQYALKHHQGNLILAQKIVNIFQYNIILSSKAKRGFNSLLLCLNLLKSEDFMNLKRVKNYPLFKVYLESKQPAWTLFYGRDLRDKFTIVQTSDELGVDKELVLNFEDSKEYFLDLFATYTDLFVKRIVCWVNKEKQKNFYTASLGVVWNLDECASCVELKLSGQKLPESCKHLLTEKCYNQIRHGVDFTKLFQKRLDIDSQNPDEADEYIKLDLDPYEILGIPKNSSYETIRKAFMTKSLIYHPDKGGDQKDFELIQKAYRILVG